MNNIFNNFFASKQNSNTTLSEIPKEIAIKEEPRDVVLEALLEEIELEYKNATNSFAVEFNELLDELLCQQPKVNEIHNFNFIVNRLKELYILLENFDNSFEDLEEFLTPIEPLEVTLEPPKLEDKVLTFKEAFSLYTNTEKEDILKTLDDVGFSVFEKELDKFDIDIQRDFKLYTDSFNDKLEFFRKSRIKSELGNNFLSTLHNVEETTTQENFESSFNTLNRLIMLLSTNDCIFNGKWYSPLHKSYSYELKQLHNFYDDVETLKFINSIFLKYILDFYIWFFIHKKCNIEGSSIHQVLSLLTASNGLIEEIMAENFDISEQVKSFQHQNTFNDEYDDLLKQEGKENTLKLDLKDEADPKIIKAKKTIRLYHVYMNLYRVYMMVMNNYYELNQIIFDRNQKKHNEMLILQEKARVLDGNRDKEALEDIRTQIQGCANKYLSEEVIKGISTFKELFYYFIDDNSIKKYNNLDDYFKFFFTTNKTIYDRFSNQFNRAKEYDSFSLNKEIYGTIRRNMEALKHYIIDIKDVGIKIFRDTTNYNDFLNKIEDVDIFRISLTQAEFINKSNENHQNHSK